MAENIPELRKRQPAAHGGGVRGDQYVARRRCSKGDSAGCSVAAAGSVAGDALMALGATGNMTAEPETGEKDPTLPAAAREHPKKRIQDDEENAGIAAGYTYLGQFIDHDITFDPASSLQQQNDPDGAGRLSHAAAGSRLASTAAGPTTSRTCTTAANSGSGGRCSSWTRRPKPGTCHGSAIRTIRTAPSAR